MMVKKSITALFVVLLVAQSTTHAEIQPARIFGDNMVLQRDMPVPVWGQTQPGEKVAVTFGGQTKTALADKDGRWRVTLDPVKASVTGTTLTVKGAKAEETVTFSDVLVGDVWLYIGSCGALHWRQFRAGRRDHLGYYYDNQPYIDADRKAATLPQIRTVSLVDGDKPTPWHAYQASKDWRKFLSIPFFFGRRCWEEQKVAVAVVYCPHHELKALTPLSGFQKTPGLEAVAERVASWDADTPAGKAALSKWRKESRAWYAALRQKLAGDDPIAPTQPPPLPRPDPKKTEPATHYRSRLASSIPLAARGVFVHSHMFDLKNPDYAVDMSALIAGLRAEYKNEKLPVCVMQTTNPMYFEVTRGVASSDWALARQRQAEASSIPNVYVQATYDSTNDARDPQHHARRMATWALGLTQGKKILSGPVLKSHQVKGNTVTLTFDGVGTGLMTAHRKQEEDPKETKGGVKGFMLSDGSGQWHEATATVENKNTVVVSSKEVTNPVHVRYAFAPQPEGANLYNRESFLAVPFRTDREAPASAAGEAVLIGADRPIEVGDELTLGDLFSDNMVLQRERPVRIWGFAAAGAKVTVQFAGQTAVAVAGKDVNPYTTPLNKARSWMVTLKPLAVSKEPQSMTVRTEAETRTLKNILVGDVWICSGQSNMGRNVGRHPMPKNLAMSHPLIRYQGGGNFARYPEDLFRSWKLNWRVCEGEEAVKGCVAVGFYFARRIQQEVDVPIGLLWPAYAGSIIQEWIPADGFRKDPALKAMSDRVDAWYPNTPVGRAVWREKIAAYGQWLDKAETALDENVPLPGPQPRMPEPQPRDICGFYNGKIHPMVPFAAKGVVWYQGESDFRTANWSVMMGAFSKSWSERFTDGAVMPLYFMQLQRSGSYCSPLIRDQQFKSLKVPGTGMAVLMDLDVDVHPANKTAPGERAALWALAKDYGKKDILYSGPLYKSHKVEGHKIVIEFDHAETGLMLGKKVGLNPAQEMPGTELSCVEIAGADKKFKTAKAQIQGKTLVVSSDEVAEPVAVRYAYTNIPKEPFLYNKAGLPAAQFRTDDW